VNEADEVRHALAQIQHAIRAPCVEINGHFQRLVKAHCGGAMKDDVNSPDQDVLVRGLEPEFQQAYVALYGADLAEGGRKFRSYPVKDLRSRKTVSSLRSRSWMTKNEIARVSFLVESSGNRENGGSRATFRRIDVSLTLRRSVRTDRRYLINLTLSHCRFSGQDGRRSDANRSAGLFATRKKERRRRRREAPRISPTSPTRRTRWQ